MEGTLIYFSPTGSTKKLAARLASQVFSSLKAEYDLTLPAQRSALPAFTENETLLAAIPVYSGRLPAAVNAAFASLRGRNTPAILVAVYGNRDFDDALFELRDILEKNGFLCVAAAALIAEHSIVPSIGRGRPDGRDLEQADAFAARIRGKLSAWIPAAHVPVSIPGKAEYRRYLTLPIHPHAGRKCVSCGLCAANCPVSAIPADNPRETIAAVCITCLRCVQLCPHKARSLSFLERFAAAQSLKKKCRTRREPELFI